MANSVIVEDANHHVHNIDDTGSHSTISCEYGMCSSDVLTIILFEIWSFQFFELAGGRRRDALANCMLIYMFLYY